MTAFFEAFSAFLATGTIWVYLVIFFGKIVEVSLGTLRIVLINRGERLIGSLIALIEISLWLIIAGNVLSDYQSDPFKMLAYALAYALGNYVGSWLEERLHADGCDGSGNKRRHQRGAPAKRVWRNGIGRAGAR